MKSNTIEKQAKEYNKDHAWLENEDHDSNIPTPDPLKEMDHELNDIFIPTWNNKPDPVPPVLTLNDVSILTYQNTSSIIASPGYGKSSIFEAILSNMINQECDSLGFEVNRDIVKKAIYIDFERRTNDVWNSFERMCKRSGIKENTDVDNVWMFGFHAVTNFEMRKQKLERIIAEVRPELILLDGAGDMVKITNDETESILLRQWFREISNKYQCSIITTLHPNPKTDKPRGWIGSELLRESESVLIIVKDESNIHTITTDFAHGKNRNSGKAESRYRFDPSKGMFISCDPKTGYKEGISILEENVIKAILKDIGLEKPGAGINTETLTTKLKDAIKRNAPKVKVGTDALKSHIGSLQTQGWIYKTQEKTSVFYFRTNQEFN